MSAPPNARHLLIPFAGRGSPACRAALAGLRLPKLEALLARLARVHEDTAGRQHPLAAARARAGRGARHRGRRRLHPWAALEAKRAGLGPTEGGQAWGVATLCHWQVGIDDVVLGDPAAIRDRRAEESAALLAAARPSSRKTASRCMPRRRRAAGWRRARSSTAWRRRRSIARSASRSRSGRPCPMPGARCAGCRTRCRCCSTPSA